MLNRRILRIKAFKAIYSYTENRDATLRELEAQLDRSLESTRDLYLFLMACIVPLTNEALSRLEVSVSDFVYDRDRTGRSSDLVPGLLVRRPSID